MKSRPLLDRQVTLICSVRGPSNESRIVRNLHKVLAKTLPVEIVECAFTGVGLLGGMAAIVRQVRSAARSEVVIIHSPFALTFASAITAWLLRRRLIAFAWDSYPCRIAGRYYDRRLFRRIADLPELFIPKIVTQTVIPTNDFRMDQKYQAA